MYVIYILTIIGVEEYYNPTKLITVFFLMYCLLLVIYNTILLLVIYNTIHNRILYIFYVSKELKLSKIIVKSAPLQYIRLRWTIKTLTHFINLVGDIIVRELTDRSVAIRYDDVPGKANTIG